jgi:hypothetical protein
MGLFEKLFPNREQEKVRREPYTSFKLLNGYTPVFHTWRGSIYESELVRAAIDAKSRHRSKLQITIQGSAKPSLQTKLKGGPNPWQTWSQFLYRTSTILEVRNNAFIVPLTDRYGDLYGYSVICPHSWELVTVGEKNIPWIRFTFEAGREKAAIELSRVGILTRHQYKSDMFGTDNRALDETMQLISIQRQGVEEYAKNASSFRFMARLTNFTKAEDLSKERQRFDIENFQQDNGGGLLLFPNTYTDIKQLSTQSYAVDADQLKLIRTSVQDYYGVSEKVIQNAAYGDEFSAFYEGEVETFAIQLSEVMTKMTFTERERSYGAEIFFTANRLQYMTNADKLAVASELVDRGLISINEAREIWNLPPVEGGDVRIIRGEYYNADDKVAEEEPAEE